MPYNTEHPKRNSLYPTIEASQPPRSVDRPLIEQLLPLAEIAQFYGTDAWNTRDAYNASIARTITSRVEPVKNCWDNRRDYFFKPYPSASEGLAGFINAPASAALITLCALGIYGNPYLLIASVCLPATVELIAGLVSLSQFLYYKGKATHTRNQEDHDKASEYLLDATNRFALVLPLLVVSAVALPFEFARFFTRSLATVTKYMERTSPSFTPDVDVHAPTA